MVRNVLLIALGSLVMLAALSSAYTVDEREQVLITQFGRPVGEPVRAAGLHFKVPFVQKVNRLEKRWLEWDGDVDEMRTAEKTPILVDTYARWRIVDPLKFFLRLRDEERAQSRLDDIIESETRNALASVPLAEIVRATNRALPPPESAVEGVGVPREPTESAAGGEAPRGHPATGDERVRVGRDELTRRILERVSRTVPDLGIEVVDLRFQRVNYTAQVERRVFDRMISERKRIAALYRSEGQGEAARIQGEMTEELKTIESEAYELVQQLEGAADAKATRIYARAHALDPELYRLLKSLESYESTLDKDTWVMLSTDSDFFRALKQLR